MIKKGSKVILKKPLKVLSVYTPDDFASAPTVTVRIEFRNAYGNSLVEEVELPRSYVKEFKGGNLNEQNK